MKRLTMAPRTPAWYAVRAESWTASAAAVLVVKENAELLRDYAASKGVTLDISPLLAVGLTSYFGNTLWTAWAEKVGRIPRFRGNEHTERGQENEVLVLDHFESSQMLVVERDVTATSSSDQCLLASFDAVAPASSDTTVSAPYGFPVEAKCPAFNSRKKLWDAKKAGGLAIMGLPYYWCQVQHQMLVSEAPYAWFVAGGAEEDETTKAVKIVFPIVEKVPRDEAFLTAYRAAAKFYHEEFIEGYVEPPKLPSDEAMLRELAEQAAFDKAIASSDTEAAVDLYLTALKAEEDAAKRRKELEAKLLKAAADARAEGSDVVVLADKVQVLYSNTKTVAWQKVAKELGKKVGGIEPAIVDACTSERSSVRIKEVL